MRKIDGDRLVVIKVLLSWLTSIVLCAIVIPIAIIVIAVFLICSYPYFVYRAAKDILGGWDATD